MGIEGEVHLESENEQSSDKSEGLSATADPLIQQGTETTRKVETASGELASDIAQLLTRLDQSESEPVSAVLVESEPRAHAEETHFEEEPQPLINTSDVVVINVNSTLKDKPSKFAAARISENAARLGNATAAKTDIAVLASPQQEKEDEEGASDRKSVEEAVNLLVEPAELPDPFIQSSQKSELIPASAAKESPVELQSDFASSPPPPTEQTSLETEVTTDLGASSPLSSEGTTVTLAADDMAVEIDNADGASGQEEKSSGALAVSSAPEAGVLINMKEDKSEAPSAKDDAGSKVPATSSSTSHLASSGAPVEENANESKAGKSGSKDEVLTPTDKLFTVRSPYYKYVFSFSIFAALLGLAACAALFFFPSTFDAPYLKFIETYHSSRAYFGAWRSPPRAFTNCGLITGSLEGDVAVFRGVPFAQSPTGARRWLPPQDLICRPNETYQALDQKPFCFQRAIDGFNISVSEDCLFLNIWVPDWDRKEPQEAALPVMVYVPGDELTGLTATDLQWTPSGSNLATQYGVIFVTVAYRVGPFGFLPHATNSSSNFGLMDLVAALRWLNSNIEGFGGDARQVTIVAHGSGASLGLAALAEVDDASELAARAWLSCPSSKVLSLSLEEAYRSSAHFIDSLGCRSKASAAELLSNGTRTSDPPLAEASVAACLRNKSAHEILNATSEKWLKNKLSTLPTKAEGEGKESERIESPFERVRRLNISGTSLVVGVSAQEAGAEALAGWDYQAFVDHVQDTLSTIDPALTEKVINYYLNLYNRSDDLMAIEAIYNTIITDMRIVCPLFNSLAKQNADQKASTSAYLVQYRPSVPIHFSASNSNRTTLISRQAVRGFDILAIFDLLTKWFIAHPTESDIAYAQSLQKQFRSFLHSPTEMDLLNLSSARLNVYATNGSLADVEWPYANCAQVWDHFPHLYDRFAKSF